MSRPPTIQWPSTIDWTQPDSAIAGQVGCGRWWVWRRRKELGKGKPTQRKVYTRQKPIDGKPKAH